jgi:dTDP-glucose 4,6-dehydratase
VRLALGETQDRVVVLDKLTYAGNLESLKEAEGHPRFAFVEGDIADRDGVRKVFREHRPGAVVNFAAETHVDRSIDDPAAFIKTNVGGTFELLEASRHYLAEVGPEARQAFRFLHVSTDEVYGSLGPTGLFTEDTAYAPNSPYAASKAGADHLVRAYHETFGLPITISNCANNYGPFQFPEKVLPVFTTRALDDLPLPMYASTQNRREWLHVRDHNRAIDRILHDGRVGETYMVGSGREASIEEIADLVLDTLGKPPSLKQIVPDRPGHDRRYAVDATKIRRELGWTPEEAFEPGIRATVRWYAEHRGWWEPLRDRAPVVESAWGSTTAASR